MRGEVGVALLLSLLSAILECNCVSSPGKPVLLNCRSPEKETFTCWWEPGSDGGLSTTHRLYYQREDLEGLHECPDYMSAGRNSCFFDKSHTSIWVNYNLTVVASNALGSTSSDPLEVDVMYIVQPNAPENVTVFLGQTEESPHLLIKWEPPRDTDTQSGWVTANYQLRVKRESDREWEEYLSGKQTEFSIYSLHPGEVYMVQVRCKLDHGDWGAWSTTTYREVPDYTRKERPARILVSIFSASALIAAMCILVMKGKYVKHCLLPPVPGPKIRGFDTQLLKSRRPEDILSTLIINQSFPPMVAGKDQMEECLVVFDSNQCFPLDTQKTQKRKTSVIIPSGFQLLPQAYSNEPSIDQSDREKTMEKNEGQVNIPESNKPLSGQHLYTAELPHFSTQKQPRLSENSSGEHLNYTERTVEKPSNHDGKPSVYHTMENIVSPTDNGYVDIQRHEGNVQEADERREDYSKVSGVNGDNVLLLQRDTVPLSNTSWKERDYHGDCTNQRLSKPHLTVPTKGECIELVDSGYVDTMPLSQTM